MSVNIVDEVLLIEEIIECMKELLMKDTRDKNE